MNDTPLEGANTASIDDPDWDSASGIELAGPTRSIVFPPICVRCGAPASSVIRITKVFRRRYLREPRPYRIYSIEAPVCAACAELHRSEERPPDPEVRRKRLRLWFWQDLVPYSLPLAALGLTTYLLGPSLLPLISPKLGVPTPLLWGGVAAFFALLALSFFAIFVGKGMWRLVATPENSGSSWHARFEWGPLMSRLFLPVGPTSVVSAVDFSDNIGDVLAGERHRYWFRNPEVGTRFVEANEGRVWNPRSPRARISYAIWCVLFAGLVLLVLVVEFGDLVGIRLPLRRR